MFKLEFETGNIAFEDDALRPQVAYVLRTLAMVLNEGNTEDNGVVCDINGNVIGKWSIGGNDA